MYDVIIIGGSFAGLSAALQLARARRKILLIDDNNPRNRYAKQAHGFLCHDGFCPSDIVKTGKEQLAHYSTVSFVDGRATEASGEKDNFEVKLANGEKLTARRLILAVGIVDEIPDVPGLKERWGKTLLHCPYCHGYEIEPGTIGFIDFMKHYIDDEKTMLASVKEAMLIADWGPVILFTNGQILDDNSQKTLAEKNIQIESAPVVALTGEAPELESVKLEDGRDIPVNAVFSMFPTRIASSLAEDLGCETTKGLFGPMIVANEHKETTVPGVYAAGDAAMPSQNATLASADGVKAGIGVHQSLVFD